MISSPSPNIDGYDADRYTPPLEAGLAKHGLTPADVLAVTQGSGVWAICTVGIFEAWIAGIFKKQNTVGPLIRWTQVTAVREEPSSHRTMRTVLMGGATEFARIDFGAGGMENTPEIAAAHRARIWRALDEAGARTTSGGSRVDAVRAATAMTASQPVDLSYITDAFLAQEADAPYQNDVMDPFSGATADAIIATYGGAPLGSTRGPSSSVAHRYLHFGHQAALVDDRRWLRRVAEYRDGNWVAQPTLVFGSGEAQIVGSCTDGSPLWEFRL